MSRAIFGRPIRIVSVALIIAVAFAAGAAVTAISAPPSTTFYGCVARAGGSLYAVGTSPSNCRYGDSQISWNQEGTQGLQGPQGIQGPQGPAGDPGIPTAYSASIAADGPTVGSDPVEILSIDVPAGSYTVNAVVNGYDATPTTNFSCYLTPGSAAGWAPTDSDPLVHTALTDLVTLQEAGSIQLHCLTANETSVVVHNSYMTVTQVLNGNQPD